MTWLNRARMTTATTGTGTVTLASASSGFMTFAEAGAVNAVAYSYCIEDGADFELGIGTYTSSGTTFSRDAVTISKISGSTGTSKINLSGSATIFIVARAQDIRPIYATLSADRTLTNTTSSQAIFESGSDEFAVEASSIYEFRLHFFVTSMSATSGNASFSLLGAGTATLTGGRGHNVGYDNNTLVGTIPQNGGLTDTSVAMATMVTAATGTGLGVTMQGMFIVNAAGTIIPSLALTTAAAAIVDRYSHFILRRLGPSSQLSLGAS